MIIYSVQHEIKTAIQIYKIQNQLQELIFQLITINIHQDNTD